MFAVNANAKVKQRQAVVGDAMISSTQQQAPRAQQTEPLDVTIGSWYVEDWGDDGELYMYTADNSMGFYFDLIYGEGANDLIRDKEYTVADVYVSENTGEQYAGIFYDNEWHYGIKTLSLTKTIDADRHVHFAGSVLDSLDNAYTFHYDEGGAPQVTTYTLQLVADPEKGSVAVSNLLGSDIIDNGNGNYTVPENAEVTILATPLEGYELTGWKVGNRWCDFTDCGTALNTVDNPLTFTMTEDVAYKAEFAAVTPQPVVNLKAIEFQVPASWENDTTYITAEDFPGFVATTYDIAKTLSVPSDIMIIFVYDFPGDDESSLFMKYGGEVIEESTTANYARGAFFNIANSVHIYYPVLDEPEPQPVEATVVFAANGNTKEVTVTLPHTFWCDLENENGELDLIIQELYALPLGGYCDFFYDGPEATGNPAVTAGADENSNHFITISEAFEGTATVSGMYNKYTEIDEDLFTYTLTISTKEGGATAISNTAVDTKAVKMIQNGQLFIEMNGTIYNVLGTVVR